MATLPGQTTTLGRSELEELVRYALAENRARLAEARENGAFLDPVFECLRILKSHAEFRALEAEEAATLAQRIVPSFFDELPTETSLGEAVDPVSAFLDGWDAVQVPEGSMSRLEGVIRGAAERAVGRSHGADDRFGPQLTGKHLAPLRAFLTFLEELQRDFDPDPFPLPQRLVGEILGCEQTQVSRWVRNARRFDLLRREKKASRAKRRAAEYRFLRPTGSGNQVVE